MRYLYALSAAFLFALSVPLGKTLLTGLKPLELSALCYLGGGLGLLAYKLLTASAKEAPLEKKDWPYVAGFTLAGGVLAPAFLFMGLNLAPSSAASLLLNFELVFTALIAVLFFKEHGGKRFWSAAILVTAGGMALSFEPGGLGLKPGLVLVALASLMWGVDNNLTAKVSLKDPVSLAVIKGLVGGSVTLGLAFYSGGDLPGMRPVLLALLLGFCCYGVSLVFLIRSMRELGASRAGAFFGIYPFIGAVFSFIWLGESPDARFGAAFALMGSAAWLLAGEKHGHEHEHDAMEHEHFHAHDLHHSHPHGAGAPAGEAHAHTHFHEHGRHTHEHLPDGHHRHHHG